jgi:hypothetical protein
VSTAGCVLGCSIQESEDGISIGRVRRAHDIGISREGRFDDWSFALFSINLGENKRQEGENLCIYLNDIS